MHKLDSVFRESQRLNFVLAIGPLGIVDAKNGTTTLSGVFIPERYQVGIPAFEDHIILLSGVPTPSNSAFSDSPTRV